MPSSTSRPTECVLSQSTPRHPPHRPAQHQRQKRRRHHRILVCLLFRRATEDLRRPPLKAIIQPPFLLHQRLEEHPENTSRGKKRRSRLLLCHEPKIYRSNTGSSSITNIVVSIVTVKSDLRKYVSRVVRHYRSVGITALTNRNSERFEDLISTQVDLVWRLRPTLEVA
eukprot:Pompholyxophrys_punicea_v1_NODE_2_length_10808_cov_35.677950.p5 type:complete len:169 gc:universal NODE_2_length_10808_cov_35.677950:5021-5527(+)